MNKFVMRKELLSVLTIKERPPPGMIPQAAAAALSHSGTLQNLHDCISTTDLFIGPHKTSAFKVMKNHENAISLCFEL